MCCASGLRLRLRVPLLTLFKKIYHYHTYRPLFFLGPSFLSPQNASGGNDGIVLKSPSASEIDKGTLIPCLIVNNFARYAS